MLRFRFPWLLDLRFIAVLVFDWSESSDGTFHVSDWLRVSSNSTTNHLLQYNNFFVSSAFYAPSFSTSTISWDFHTFEIPDLRMKKRVCCNKRVDLNRVDHTNTEERNYKYQNILILVLLFWLAYADTPCHDKSWFNFTNSPAWVFRCESGSYR